MERPDVYPENRLWLVRDEGVVVGVGMLTPPFNMTVSRPDAERALAALAAVRGLMRRAEQGDRELLIEWMAAFAVEALPTDSPTNAERMVDLRLQGGKAGLFLWEDGEAVSVVGYGGHTPNGARIGPVYTPPAFRRRGYASALTAGVSHWLLESGRRFCFLYTDLSNPTSNRIYQDIGYEPVCDSAEYRFEPGPR